MRAPSILILRTYHAISASVLTIESFGNFSRMNINRVRVSVQCLRNVKQCSIVLLSSFDGRSTKRPETEGTFDINPFDSVRVSDKNFVSVELEVPDVEYNCGDVEDIRKRISADLYLFLLVTNHSTLLEPVRCFSEHCVQHYKKILKMLIIAHTNASLEQRRRLYAIKII